jgi:hypothetical protein
MPGSAHPTPAPPHTPPRIDLSEITEATRRRLYDAAVAVHFRTPPDTEDWMPFYNADQARLAVFRYAGRWFLTWYSLEEVANDDLPEAAKHQLLTIVQAPEDSGAAYGVEFHEV